MRSVRLRFMALVLAVLTLLSAACVPAAAQDHDARKMTGEEAAAVLYGMGLFRGRGTLPDGSSDFRLGGTLTIAEAVALLARLMCEPPLAAFPGIRHEPVADGGYVSSPEAFIDAVGDAALSLTDEVRFSVPQGQAGAYVKAFQKAIRESGSSPAPNFESYSGEMSAADDWVLLRFRYCDDARIMRWLEGIDGDIPDEDRETYELAYSAWRSLAKPGMDEYELVKAFHDWIVDNCEYDSAEGPYCRDAYGVFKLGKAVCDGYAKAMNLL